MAQRVAIFNMLSEILDFLNTKYLYWRWMKYADKISCSTENLPHRIIKFIVNKTPEKAFTPPADEKQMGTTRYLGTTAQAGADAVMQIFLGLKVGEGLDFQIWDLNRAHETERTVFPIPQVFSMFRRRL